jgi:hypothetical protein
MEPVFLVQLRLRESRGCGAVGPRRPTSMVVSIRWSWDVWGWADDRVAPEVDVTQGRRLAINTDTGFVVPLVLVRPSIDLHHVADLQTRRARANENHFKCSNFLCL